MIATDFLYYLIFNNIYFSFMKIKDSKVFKEKEVFLANKTYQEHLLN